MAKELLTNQVEYTGTPESIAAVVTLIKKAVPKLYSINVYKNKIEISFHEIDNIIIHENSIISFFRESIHVTTKYSIPCQD